MWSTIRPSRGCPMTTSHSKKGPRTLTRWRLIDAEAHLAKPYFAFLKSTGQTSPRDPLMCDHERVRYNNGWVCTHCDSPVYDSEERVQHTFVLDQGVSGEGW